MHIGNTFKPCCLLPLQPDARLYLTVRSLKACCLSCSLAYLGVKFRLISALGRPFIPATWNGAKLVSGHASSRFWLLRSHLPIPLKCRCSTRSGLDSSRLTFQISVDSAGRF